jgi:hypothetical protein
MIYFKARLWPIVIILAAFAAIAALGVSDAQPAAPGQSAAASDAAAPDTPLNPGEKIVGVWTGTTLASCSASLLPDRCNAQQKVTITVIQGAGAKLKGFYKCSYGTQNCYRMNETGKVVDATITGKRVTMRVMMTDGTSYIFTGRVTGDQVEGGYTANSGGALLERGRWRAMKTY